MASTIIPLSVAAMTVMLWILWSDSMRTRRSHRAIYVVRVILYLTVVAIIASRLISRGDFFPPATRLLLLVTSLVGVVGAVYFARQVMVRKP